MARSAKPDLILMDLGLPGIDGWEATAQLKGDDEHAAHPDHRAERARDDERSRTGAGRRRRRLRHEAGSFERLLEKIETLLKGVVSR